jgi:O-methyltransferase involved in polyketide biosynthesis
MDEGDVAAMLLRSRELDRITGEFLARNPRAVVVHVGCGLDARYDRVDNGSVTWFDLDLPEVVTLRRQWLGGARGRYHLLAGSVLDAGWRAEVAEVADVGRPTLFVAEGVLAYFEAAAVRGLVGSLEHRFPGSELVFDAFSPFTVHVSNLRLRLSRSGVRAHYGFGLRRGEDVERWADGIRLLDQWHPFDRPEPRLARYGWVRHVPFLSRPIGVYHYRLGTPTTTA